jgi:Flp pilus assembly protein TadG
VLRIDLLPKSFALARFNKLLLVVLIVVLGVCAGGWMMYATKVQAQIDDVAASITKVQPDATAYDSTMAEISAKQADAAPIAAKVKFVDDANRSGLLYWDQYEKVRRYIYPRARLLDFSITAPNQCHFSVTVRGTTEYARFLIDLLRCPYLTITSFTPLSGGRSVPSAGEPEAGQWPTAHGKTSTAGLPQKPAGAAGGVPGMGPVGPGAGGMPGMGGPGGMPGGAPGGMPGMGGPGGAPGGMPGMGGPGGMPGGAPGGMPGMGGAPGGGGGGSATTSPDKQDITISVSGTLAINISTATPPGMAPAGGMGGMGGGMPGMGGGGGMPGMSGPGGPGGGMPGMGGGAGAGAKGGAAPGAKAGGKAGGSEDDSGGGAGSKAKDKSGGDE